MERLGPPPAGRLGNRLQGCEPAPPTGDASAAASGPLIKPVAGYPGLAQQGIGAWKRLTIFEPGDRGLVARGLILERIANA